MSRRADLLDAFIEQRHARTILNLELHVGLHLVVLGRRSVSNAIGEVAWNAHAHAYTHGPEAIEDIDLGSAHVLRGVGDGLEHWVGEGGEDVVDFGEEEGEEAGVAAAEDGEEGHELVEVVSGAHLEGLGVGGEEGQDVG